MADVSQILTLPAGQQQLVRGLNDHLRAADGWDYIPAQQMAIASGATAGFGSVSYRLTLGKAANNSDIRFQIGRHDYWTNGKLSLTLFFNSPTTGSPGQQVIRLLYTVQVLTARVAGVSPINGVVELVAAPTVAANVPQAALLANLCPVAATDLLYHFRIQRDGTDAGDTFAGDFMLFAAVPRFVAERQ